MQVQRKTHRAKKNDRKAPFAKPAPRENLLENPRFRIIFVSMIENFVVSARKYRPATFNTVVGQSHITDTLRNAIIRGQLSHAYLFTGPRGVGKTTCARIFAKAINCLNPTEDAQACGVCESCVAFDSGRSFNIHELDAASNNSVDDIRALNEKVRIAPQIGKYSLYIIDEVHMLSTGAFNAFLKTLEEPPHYAIFILATTEKHKILPTILSRCQSYDFKRIRVEDIVDYLKYIASEEGITYDEESLHMIAAKADGGMRDALSTFDRVVSFCGNNLVYNRVAESIGSLDLNTYFTAMDMVGSEDFGALLVLFDDILAKGFEGNQFLSGLLEHVRNLLVMKNPQTASLLEVSGVMAQRYGNQAVGFDVELLINAMNLLSIADTSYKGATNRRLHVELALVKLCGLKKKDSPIIERYPVPQIIVNKSVVEESAGQIQVQPQTQVHVVDKQNGNVAQLGESTLQIASSESVVLNNSESALIQVAQNQTVSAPGDVVESRPIQRQVPAAGGISKFSLSNIGSQPKAQDPSPTQAQVAISQNNLSEQEIEKILKADFIKIIQLWESRHRPRIATVMTENSISGRTITITVPDESPAQEILQNKLQIERDIMETLHVPSCIEVIIKDIPKAYAPVSVEQKLQHLMDINPNLAKLKDELDLSL